MLLTRWKVCTNSIKSVFKNKVNIIRHRPMKAEQSRSKKKRNLSYSQGQKGYARTDLALTRVLFYCSSLNSYGTMSDYLKKTLLSFHIEKYQHKKVYLLFLQRCRLRRSKQWLTDKSQKQKLPLARYKLKTERNICDSWVRRNWRLMDSGGRDVQCSCSVGSYVSVAVVK